MADYSYFLEQIKCLVHKRHQRRAVYIRCFEKDCAKPLTQTPTQDDLTPPLQFLSELIKVSDDTPELFIDLEGISLSREGELSILEIFVKANKFKYTYIIDVYVLRGLVFSTKSTNGYRTLKSILADSRAPKVFWDVRQDAAALHWQLRVPIDGIIDYQLMELATRGQSEGCTYKLLSITDAIKADAGLDAEELNLVIAIKGKGKIKFFPRGVW